MFENTLILLFLALFVYTVIKSMLKPKNFPPGPRWYPFLGCNSKVHSLTKKHGSQYKAFHVLSEEYSTEILGLNLGGELVVVFFGEKNFRETLTAEEFEGRPDNFFTRMRSFGKRAGLTMNEGPEWMIHRKFTVKHLRNAGYGKGPMEKDIQNASHDLVEWIMKQGDKPLGPKDFLPLAVMNVLWNCAAGEKIKAENWNYLQGLLQKRGKVFNVAGGLLNRAPWTRFFLPGYTGYSTLLEVNKQISAIIEETILKHKNKEVERHDLIYAFLQEMAENREPFTDDQLIVLCIDLILAGSATTSHAVEFAILQVLRDQEMQRKIQKEIDLVLGDDVPCWNDNFRLKYTSAFLLELQRYYTIVPLAGIRRALKDTVVNGYVIPKNTTLLWSLGGIHSDPNLWEDPEIFRPERFLDDKGNVKQPEHFYPFGLGRRRCLGDTLARMFIFISFTTLMQQFTVSCADDHLPSNEPEMGIMATAKSFTAVFTPRKLKNI